MNKDNESRGFNPKQRIIGAIILVVLAIIIVPLVLNKRERPADPDAPTAQTVVTELPPGDTSAEPHANDAAAGSAPLSDTAPLNPSTAPAGPSSAYTPIPSAPAATGTIPSDPARAPVAPTPSPARAGNSATPPSATTPAAPPAASKPDLTREARAPAKGWYVQVGTFASPANAEQLAARLQKAGFKVVQERVRGERNTVVRVRVGPYDKEAQAKSGQARIQKAVGIKGLVRQH